MRCSTAFFFAIVSYYLDDVGAQAGIPEVPNPGQLPNPKIPSKPNFPDPKPDIFTLEDSMTLPQNPSDNLKNEFDQVYIQPSDFNECVIRNQDYSGDCLRQSQTRLDRIPRYDFAGICEEKLDALKCVHQRITEKCSAAIAKDFFLDMTRNDKVKNDMAILRRSGISECNDLADYAMRGEAASIGMFSLKQFIGISAAIMFTSKLALLH